MKKHLILYLTGLLCLATACSDDDGNATDPWAGGIELSAENVTFSDAAPSQTIYVENGQGGWCITRVTTDDTETLLSQTEQEALRGGAAFERTFDWLGVAVEDNAIRLTANGSSAQERTFSIDLQAGYSTARIAGSRPGTGYEPLAATPQDVTMAFWGDTVTVETNKDTWWVKSVQLLDAHGPAGEAEHLYECETPAWAPGTRPDGWAFAEWFDWIKIRVDGTRLVLSTEGADSAYDFAITLTTGSEECTITGKIDEMLYGIGIPTGEIAVAPASVELAPEGGEATISVHSETWYFNRINVNGEDYHFGDPTRLEQIKDRKYELTIGWLTVEVDGYDLKVSAAPNKTGEDRTFEVEVTTFYNSGIVTGVQKGQ